MPGARVLLALPPILSSPAHSSRLLPSWVFSGRSLVGVGNTPISTHMPTYPSGPVPWTTQPLGWGHRQPQSRMWQAGDLSGPLALLSPPLHPYDRRKSLLANQHNLLTSCLFGPGLGGGGAGEGGMRTASTPVSPSQPTLTGSRPLLSPAIPPALSLGRLRIHQVPFLVPPATGYRPLPRRPLAHQRREGAVLSKASTYVR